MDDPDNEIAEFNLTFKPLVSSNGKPGGICHIESSYDMSMEDVLFAFTSLIWYMDDIGVRKGLLPRGSLIYSLIERLQESFDGEYIFKNYDEEYRDEE